MASGASPDETPANDTLLVVVTLHGITSSAEEKEEIEAAVRTVPGVRGVANKLRVT